MQSNKTMKKVIVDTDPGLDDVQAIAMLLNSPDIEVNPTLTVILENCIVQCRY